MGPAALQSWKDRWEVNGAALNHAPQIVQGQQWTRSLWRRTGTLEPNCYPLGNCHHHATTGWPHVP